MVFCLEVKAPDLDWESEEEDLVGAVIRSTTAAAERKDKKPGGRRDTVDDQAELEREIRDDIAAWFDSGFSRQETGHKLGPGFIPFVDTRRGSEATLVSGDLDEKGKGSSKQEDAADDSDRTEPAADEVVAETGAAAESELPASDTVSIPRLADKLSLASRPFGVFIPTKIPVLPNFSQGELDKILSLIRFRNFMAPSVVGSTDDTAGGGAGARSVSAPSLADPEPPPFESGASQSMTGKDISNGLGVPAVLPSKEADSKKKKNKKKKKKKVKNAQVVTAEECEPEGSSEHPTSRAIAKTDVASATKTIPMVDHSSSGADTANGEVVVAEKRPNSNEPNSSCEPKDESGGPKSTASVPCPKRNYNGRAKASSKNKNLANLPASVSQVKPGAGPLEPRALGPATSEVARTATAGQTPNKKKGTNKNSGTLSKTPLSDAKEVGSTPSESPVYKLNEKLDSAKAINRYSCLGGLADGLFTDVVSGQHGTRTGKKDLDASGGSRRNRRAVGKDSGNSSHPPPANVHKNTSSVQTKPEVSSVAAAPLTLAVSEDSPTTATSMDVCKVDPAADCPASPIIAPGPDMLASQASKAPVSESTTALKDAISQDSGCSVGLPKDATKSEIPDQMSMTAVVGPPPTKDEPLKAPVVLGWADELELERSNGNIPTSTSETSFSDGPESAHRQPKSSMPSNAPPAGPDTSASRGPRCYNHRSSYHHNRQPNHMPTQPPVSYVPSQEWANRNGSPPHQRNDHRSQYGRRYQHNGVPQQQQQLRRYYQGPQGTGPQQCSAAFTQSGSVRTSQQMPVGSAPTSPPLVHSLPANTRAHPTGALQPVGMAPTMGQPPVHFQPGPPVTYYNANMGAPAGPYGGTNVPVHPQMMSGSQFIPPGNFHGGRYNGNRHPRAGGQRYDSYQSGSGRSRSYQRYDQQQQVQTPGVHASRGQYHQRQNGSRSPYAFGAHNPPTQQHQGQGAPTQVGSRQVAPSQDVSSQSAESIAMPAAAAPESQSVPPRAAASDLPAKSSKPASSKERIMIALDYFEEDEDESCSEEGAGYTKLMAHVLAGLQENGVRVVGCSIEPVPDSEVVSVITVAAS